MLRQQHIGFAHSQTRIGFAQPLTHALEQIVTPQGLTGERVQHDHPHMRVGQIHLDQKMPRKTNALGIQTQALRQLQPQHGQADGDASA